MTAYESTTARPRSQELGACALIQDLLPLYIEGEVTPASRDLIAEHLAGCDRCAGFLAGARSVREQLRREHNVRQASVGHDQAARQAMISGRRQLLSLVVLVFAALCLTSVAGVVMFGFVRGSSSAPANAIIPVAPTAPPPVMSDLDGEQRLRALEEAGMVVRDPVTGQPLPYQPDLLPTPTPVPFP